MTIDIGNPAPEFSLPATGGKTISLAELKGQIVVLYFYPKDDTPGCTTEACDFRDNFNTLKSQGVTVLGLSKDSISSHEKFKEKYGLNFDLLSDTDGAVINAYGSWVEKSMYGKKYMGIDRSTFLIDTNGKLQKIWRKVSVTKHVADVMNAVKELQQTKAA